MSVDDILYGQINIVKPQPPTDQQMIDTIKVALTWVFDMEFWMDTAIGLSTYEQIADVIMQHPNVISACKTVVTHDPLRRYRPVNAISIKDIFKALYDGTTNTFWLAGKSRYGYPINKINISNWFGIDSEMPMLHISNNDYFEWWVLGLMPD